MKAFGLYSFLESFKTMIQMKPDSSQSEIGIRLPFSSIDQYLQMLEWDSAQGRMLAIDLPEFDKLNDISDLIVSGLDKLSVLNTSYIIGVQNLTTEQLPLLRDILSRVPASPLTIINNSNNTSFYAGDEYSDILSPTSLPDELLESLAAKTVPLNMSEADGESLETFFDNQAKCFLNNGTRFCLQLSALMLACRAAKINPSHMLKKLPMDAVCLISLGGSHGGSVSGEDDRFESLSSVMSHDIRVLYGHCLTHFGPQKTLMNFQDFLDVRAKEPEPFAYLEQACRSAQSLGPEMGQAQLEKF